MRFTWSGTGRANFLNQLILSDCDQSFSHCLMTGGGVHGLRVELVKFLFLVTRLVKLGIASVINNRVLLKVCLFYGKHNVFGKYFSGNPFPEKRLVFLCLIIRDWKYFLMFGLHLKNDWRCRRHWRRGRGGSEANGSVGGARVGGGGGDEREGAKEKERGEEELGFTFISKEKKEKKRKKEEERKENI